VSFVKEMSFKSGVKGRGSDRWWEQRWWWPYAWWGDRDAQDEVNQEDSEQNEVDGMKKGADWAEPLDARGDVFPILRWNLASELTRIVGLPDGEEIVRFDTIPACDRRTNRHAALAKTRVSITSRW